MGTSFFIMPFDPLGPMEQEAPDFRIDVDDYARRLQARWPNAHMNRAIPRLAIRYEWSLDERYLHGVHVSLYSDGHCVALEGSGANFIEFVMWHRAMVDPRHDLYLFSDSDITPLNLRPETTAADIEAYYGGPRILVDTSLGGTWIGQAGWPDEGEALPMRLYVHHYANDEVATPVTIVRPEPFAAASFVGRGHALTEGQAIRIELALEPDHFNLGELEPNRKAASKSMQLTYSPGETGEYLNGHWLPASAKSERQPGGAVHLRRYAIDEIRPDDWQANPWWKLVA